MSLTMNNGRGQVHLILNFLKYTFNIKKRYDLVGLKIGAHEFLNFKTIIRLFAAIVSNFSY